MPIDLECEGYSLPKEALPAMERALAAALRLEGAPEDAVMALRITNDAGIHEINRAMRGVDAPTDVLSFPSVQFPAHTVYSQKTPRLPREGGHPFLGDAVISLERAEAQGREYGHGTCRELAYLTAHSALHLLGYDHMEEADKAKMREKEREIMEETGLYRDEELLEKALKAMEMSYSPYSRFRVGACILGADGKTYIGANIENASYGATICAERAALSRAVVDGCRRFKAIAIAGDEPAWPCGICRQALNEFSEDMKVIVGTKEGIVGVMRLSDLLPHSFGPENLGVEA